MNQRLRRLEGYATGLLDSYLSVRMTFGLLAPLAGDPDAELPHNRPGTLHGGLSALRRVLFNSCVLDIARLAWDRDKRTRSIANLVAALEDEKLLEALRSAHTATGMIHTSGDEEEHSAALAAINAHELARRRVNVDAGVERIRGRWKQLDSNPLKKDVLTLRNQHIAHLEMRFEDGVYVPVSPAGLRIRRSDVRNLLTAVEEIVLDLTSVIRDADFAIDRSAEMFDSQGVRLWKRLLE